MSGALILFAISLFCLLLILLTGIRHWRDTRSESTQVLRQQVHVPDLEAAPLARPAPPTRRIRQEQGSPYFELVYRIWRRWQQRKHLECVEEQLPDALDYLNRALRAGHDLSRAIQLGSAELQEPLAMELRMVAEEISYGGGLSIALQHLAQRLPSADIRTLAVAGSLHRETGGDITRVFERLARVIRERSALREQIRVLSAEGRMSAWVLSLLPVGCGALVQSMHPGLMGILLTDPLGRWALVGALTLWLSGVLMMRHMIRMEQ